MIHLVREMHDMVSQPTSIWCPAPATEWSSSFTQDIDEATCLDCLDEARRYGGEARRRMEQLRRGSPTPIE